MFAVPMLVIGIPVTIWVWSLITCNDVIVVKIFLAYTTDLFGFLHVQIFANALHCPFPSDKFFPGQVNMVWGVVRNLVHCLCPIVDVTKFIDDKRVFILTIFSCGIELKPVLVPRQPPMDGNSVVEAKPKVFIEPRCSAVPLAKDAYAFDTSWFCPPPPHMTTMGHIILVFFSSLLNRRNSFLDFLRRREIHCYPYECDKDDDAAYQPTLLENGPVYFKLRRRCP
mmetsp:Transcript_10235/g.30229  ORF Transcript_10235/g.30229 Transcript_10235/m.30229 type:complete len:225 (+) Transcript_10235:419-1093(+)